MKTLFLTSASIALLICCLGCPSGDGGSDNAKPVANKLTDDSTNATSPEADVVISKGMFDVAGVKLGMTYDAWKAFYPEESGVSIESVWVTEKSTGISSVIPADPEIAPFDNAWFLNTQLVGFYSDFSMTEDEFDVRVEGLVGKFGESLEEPPAWVIETPFFSEYQKQESGFVQHFWINKDAQEVLMAIYMEMAGEAMFSLINLEMLDGRIEEALQAKFNTGDQMPLSEPQASDGAEALEQQDWTPQKPAPVPDGEFGFDGVYLGFDANQMKGRFESMELTSMGMWVDKDWTGRLDGIPMDGTSYPAEAAWFLDGELVGFLTTVPGTEADFSETTANYVDMNGAPLSTIPDWASESEFFSSYSFSGDEEGVAIWCDETSRGMLFLTYDPFGSEITTMLVDVDDYREAMETTNEAVGSQGHSM